MQASVRSETAQPLESFTTKLRGVASERLVVVRFYLDRPGYDINHSSARIWRNPPETCRASDIEQFLHRQGILTPDDGIIAEIYLDRFQSYMLLEAWGADVILDFAHSTPERPGTLNIRLTDMHHADHLEKIPGGDGLQGSQKVAVAVPPPSKNCNMGPAGLFAFSLTVALETSELMNRMGYFVADSFVLTYATYAFFVSGLLQLLVGMWEVTRNNIYGATAFSAFGCFWLSNGLRLILTNYFGESIPEELLVADPWGNFIRNLYILGFALVLFKQTLIMNKVTTTLITLLSFMMLWTCFTGWSEVMEWFQVVFGWMVSGFAFFTFTAEMTNEVYHRQVFNLYPWVDDSGEEIFGAAGRSASLYSKAARLRTASIHQDTPLVNSSSPTATTHHQVRAVLPHPPDQQRDVDVKVNN